MRQDQTCWSPSQRRSPVQHRKEHPTDDRSQERDLDEGGERDPTADGERVSRSTERSRPGSGCCAGQDPDRASGPRNRAGQPESGDVGGGKGGADSGHRLVSFRCGDALCTGSPCLRTTGSKSSRPRMPGLMTRPLTMRDSDRVAPCEPGPSGGLFLSKLHRCPLVTHQACACPDQECAQPLAGTREAMANGHRVGLLGALGSDGL